MTKSPGTSRSGLALSDDGKWLAYFRFKLDDSVRSLPVKFVEIIEADTGKVVRSLNIGESLEQVNTLAFDGRDQDVLLARAERVYSPPAPRPVYVIERWSRFSGKVTGTISLPVAASGPRGFVRSQSGRLVFSADRKSLLSIPAEPGGRSTVWDLTAAKPRTTPGSSWVHSERSTVSDLAVAKPLREFDDNFVAEAFFPDGRRIIGMTGSDIVVRDATTGGVTKRWPMPDGLVSVMGNMRNTPRSMPGGVPILNTLQPDAQSLWVSPDGRWVAAFGQHPMADSGNNGIQMPTEIFLFDAESGQVRVRIPIPDIPAGNPPIAPAPPLAFDDQSRLLAVATAKSLSLFSVPDGAPVTSGALPELGSPSPGAPGATQGPPISTMPTGLLFTRGASRLYEAAYPWDPKGITTGGLPASAKLVGEVVLSWDLTLPRTKVEDHRHDGPVRGVRLDPRGRFVTAAGDDRVIRVWDRGGSLRWSVGYHPRAGMYRSVIPWDTQEAQWGSGSFDPTGAVIFTRLPDRTDVWDATSGERRGSFTSVLAASPDQRYLVVLLADGSPQARELRILDVTRNAAVMSIPWEHPWEQIRSEARFSPDSRFLVVAGRANPGAGARNSTLLIADLAEARVVARLQNGDQWAIGPAGKVLVVGAMAGDKPVVLRAYALATGRQIGEPTGLQIGESSGGIFPSLPGTRDLSAIAPDDRKMAVPTWKGSTRTELKYLVWQFDKDEKIPIAGNWTWPRSIQDRWTYFDASGTRLLISGWQETGPSASRYVVELWNLAGLKRLMSTADAAPEPTIGPRKFVFDPGQGAFATLHDPQKNPDGIGAIVWETSTGRVLGRYKGSPLSIPLGSEDGDYFRLDDNAKSTLTSLKTLEARAIPGLYSHLFGVPGFWTAVSHRITRSEDNLTLTDLETGRTRAALRGQMVLPGAFTRNGKRLATESLPGPNALNVWDVATGKLLRSVPLHNASYAPQTSDVHFSPNGRRLAFNLNDRFRVLDVDSGRLVAIDRPGHRAAIRAVDLSPDGALVASAGDDAAVCLWEAATGRFVAMLEEENEPIAAVSFSPDGRSLAVRALAGRVRVWRLERAQDKDRITVAATSAWDTTSLGSAAGASATSGPVFVSQGRLVAFGAGDGTIALREATSGRVERMLRPESGRAAVAALAARPDGEYLASGDAEGVVRLWDLSADTPPTRLVTDQGAIRIVAFARNILAVAGGSLDLWDLNRGERLVTLETDARSVNGLELSSDGRILVSGDDRKVTLRDLDELRRLMAEIELGW
jgi:WD40 repeat protein